MSERFICNFEPVSFVKMRDMDNPTELLQIGVDILKESKFKWYVAFGTALGLHRDGEFIPDDTDFDVAVVVDTDEDLNAVQGLIEAFKSKLRYLRTVQCDGKHMQAAFVHESGMIFDLCFMYRGYKDGHYTTFADKGAFHDREDMCIPVWRETKYGWLPFPDKTEDYLTLRYDSDWQTPKYQKSTKDLNV